MKTPFKVLVVLAGYAASFLAAWAAMAYRIAHTQGPDAQASAGMYAAGDAMLFIAVFGVLAIVPSALGLWFLRSAPRFWGVLAKVTLGLVALSALAVGASGLASGGPLGGPSPSPALALFGAFGVLCAFVSPIVGALFALAALLAPERASRRAIIVAALGQFAIGAAVFVRLLLAHGR